MYNQWLSGFSLARLTYHLLSVQIVVQLCRTHCCCHFFSLDFYFFPLLNSRAGRELTPQISQPGAEINGHAM